MRELSLHLIDIIENSISAKASLIEIEVNENINVDLLSITVRDNGCGISEELLDKIKDPFVTSRSTRKVGLGLSLLEAACVRCSGSLTVKSKVGVGTEVTAVMQHSNIDRAPLGKIEDTIVTALLETSADIVYTHRIDDSEFIFDSREIKKIVGNEINDPEILQWIREFVRENIEQIGGGAWK